MFKHLPQFVLISAICSPLTLHAGSDHKHQHQDKHSHQHAAHTHGHAELNLAVDDGQLLLELSSPAANIVGFEHAPHNAQQKKTVANAIAQLQQGSQLFTIQGGNCSLAEQEVDSSLDHVGHDKQHQQDAHADFDANYRFNCQNSDDLSAIDIQLFKYFPGIETLQVQFIVNGQQGLSTLNKSNTSIQF